MAFLFMGGGDEEGHDSGGGASIAPQIANLSPEQQALVQNEAFKNPVEIIPLEKEFIVNFKPQNPDSPRTAGFAKFNLTLLAANKGVSKEVDVKLDTIRSLVNDIVSGFYANEVQSAQGRAKLRAALTSGINGVLTDGSVSTVVFPNFLIQP